jgi:hypothetical protein
LLKWGQGTRAVWSQGHADAPEHAQQVLDALEQVNLIGQLTPGRYRYHDLLQAYATAKLCAPPSA